MNDIEKLYNLWLYQSSLLANGFIGLSLLYAWWRRATWSVGLRRFFRYLLVSFMAASLVSLFIWATQKHTYYPVLEPYLKAAQISDTNFLGILAYLNDYIFLIAYFSAVLSPLRWVRQLLLITSCVLVVLGLLDYAFLSGFRAYGFFNPTAAALVGSALPLVHFAIIANSRAIVPILRNPYFWITMGLLLPNLFGLILRLAGNAIYGDNFVLYCTASIYKNIINCLGSLLLINGYCFSHLGKYFDWQSNKGPTSYEAEPGGKRPLELPDKE